MASSEARGGSDVHREAPKRTLIERRLHPRSSEHGRVRRSNPGSLEARCGLARDRPGLRTLMTPQRLVDGFREVRWRLDGFATGSSEPSVDPDGFRTASHRASTRARWRRPGSSDPESCWKAWEKARWLRRVGRSRDYSRRELRAREDINSLHCDEIARALNTA